jgi:hypothetical protein
MSSNIFRKSRKEHSRQQEPTQELNTSGLPSDIQRLKTHQTNEYSGSLPGLSDSEIYSWNSAEKADEVYEDEMNIDLTEYNIDETGLDAIDNESLDSEEEERNGKLF